MKKFLLKYLLSLSLLFVGFLTGFIYVKRSYVSNDELELCKVEGKQSESDFGECRQRLERCVYYVNGILAGKGIK